MAEAASRLGLFQTLGRESGALMRTVVWIFASIGALLTLLIAAALGYWAYAIQRGSVADEESLMYVNWGGYDVRAEAGQLTAYDTQTGRVYHADVAW